MNSTNQNIFDISIDGLINGGEFANKYANDINKLNELANGINKFVKETYWQDRIEDKINKELKSITIDDGKTTVNDIVKNEDTFVEFIKKCNKDIKNEDTLVEFIKKCNKWNKDKFSSNNSSYLFPIETKEGKRTINTENIINNAEGIKFNGEGINICFESDDLGYFYIDKFEEGKFEEGKLVDGKKIEYNVYYNGDREIHSMKEYKKKEKKNGRTVVYSKEIDYFFDRIGSIEEYEDGVECRYIRFYDSGNVRWIEESKNGDPIGCIGFYDDSKKKASDGNEKIGYIQKFYCAEKFDSGGKRFVNEKLISYHKNGNKDSIEYDVASEKHKNGSGNYAVSYNNNDENSIKSIIYSIFYYRSNTSKELTVYDSDIKNIYNNFSNKNTKTIIEISKLINEIIKLNKNIGEKLVDDICLKCADKMNKMDIDYNDKKLVKKIVSNIYIETAIETLEQLKQAKLKPIVKEAKKFAYTKIKNIKNLTTTFLLRCNMSNSYDKDKELITTIQNGLNRIKTINNIKDMYDIDLFKNNKNSKNNNNKSEEEKELSDTISKIKTKANEYIDCIVNHLYDGNIKANDYTILSGLPKATSPKSNSIRDYAIFRAVNNYLKKFRVINNYLKNEKKLSAVSKVLDRLYKDRKINKNDNLIKYCEIQHINDNKPRNKLQKKLDILNNKLKILESKFIRNNKQELGITGEDVTADYMHNNPSKLIKINKNNNGKQSLYSKLMEIDKSIEEEIRKEKDKKDKEKNNGQQIKM